MQELTRLRAEIKEIENPEMWWLLRLEKLTASEFHRVREKTEKGFEQIWPITCFLR